MIINHNLAAMNANRMMNANASQASKSMQKLSSGLKINSAADDAAGLAISEKMRAQIRGLDQASSNAQDAISMTQTAEGALNETTSILQRMRELAVQSSTDTNTGDDRSKIQSEMDELTKEVSRISNDTEFNKQKLINGGVSDNGIKAATFHVGANEGQSITLSIDAMDAKSLGITRDVSEANIDTNNNGAKISSASSDSINVTKSLVDGKYNVAVTSQAAGATTATDVTGKNVANLVSGTATKDTEIKLTYTDHGTAASNTASTALASSSTNMASATTLQVNGTNVSLDRVKALGTVADPQTSQSSIKDALQADLDKALGAGKYKVSVGATDHKISITSDATGAGTKVDLSGSNTATAALLGFDTTASAILGTNGSATGGTKDWVATGSLGGVVNAANNKVNGMTLSTSQLSTLSSSSAVGDTITVKGYKDATLSAQLESVSGTGAPTSTQTPASPGGSAGATIAGNFLGGTATKDTEITLTYTQNIGATSFASATNVTGGTHTGTGNVTVSGTYTGSSNGTLTVTQTAAASNGTGTQGTATLAANTATPGTITNAATAMGTISRTGAIASGAAGNYQLLFTDATHYKIQKEGSTPGAYADVAGATGTVGSVDTNIAGTSFTLAAATGGAYAGGDTIKFSLTADSVAKFSVSDGTTTNTNITTNTTISGLTVDVSAISGAANNNTWTQALTAGSGNGWVATGDATGQITGSSNNVNGVTIDMSGISGSANAGEKITISATVGGKVGDAVTIDQKNGGSYVLGDATGKGQVKVGFAAGAATAGTSTLDVTTDVATAAEKQADGTMSNAKVQGGLDISTQDKASSAITRIQNAIDKVSAERSKLGAYQNRLEHTINNLGTSSENLSSAESRIRDVDMAKEMSEYSKNNILSQASQAMLAQAKSAPEQVLQLLR